MSITRTPILDIGVASWTFAAFVKDRSGTQGGTILHWKPTSGNGLQIKLSVDATSTTREDFGVNFYGRNGVSEYKKKSGGISAATNYYLSASYNYDTSQACVTSTCSNIAKRQMKTVVPNILIGRQNGSSDFFKGNIFCLMLFNKALTSKDKMRLGDYCKNIYRIRRSMPDSILCK
jgi:hypothetical protein